MKCMNNQVLNDKRKDFVKIYKKHKKVFLVENYSQFVRTDESGIKIRSFEIKLRNYNYI